jgi:myo-inositol catabolism protein IolC
VIVMQLGYDKPLYLMAFDHRGSFEKGLFGSTPPISAEVHAGIVDAKQIIYEGFLRAVDQGAPRVGAGVLVDEEYGANVGRAATAAGFALAMPVERSGQAEFDFEYGDDFGAHIEAFDPTFAKVLVRYNPEGDAALNERQTERLRRLSDWLHERDRRFLFELLVPATPAQMTACDGDAGRYDREVRPRLLLEIVAAMQAAGVEPDVWKIEGLDAHGDCEKVADLARSGGRDGVVCVVLGRGADEPKVIEWLQVAAPVRGFDGFAVGRTMWQDALEKFLAGTLTRDGAVQQIADRYRETSAAYGAAA